MNGLALGVLVWGASGAAGCVVDVNHGNTVYSCAESQACPSGLQCIDDICVTASDIDGGLGNRDAGEPDAAPAPRLGGNIFFYSFDDQGSPSVIHDRSGRGRDAHVSRAVLVEGRYGQAREFNDLEDNNELQIPDSSTLFAGKEVTIEAYVNHAVALQRALIYGDEDPEALTDSVEYALSLDGADRLEFKTNGGCGTESIAFVSDDTVAADGWHHVAVAWDGTTIRFYIDGISSGERAHSTLPCESTETRGYLVGRRSDDTDEWNGQIDELKLSSVAKSGADIQASMNHDSALLEVGTCGDRLLENEVCMASESCCTTSCLAANEGSTCSTGGMCNAVGACRLEGGRTQADLLALYQFDEGAGLVVGDSSGVEPALDLTMDTPDAVVWGAGTLEITAPVIIVSAAEALKIQSAAQASGELTVEAWVAPANATQGGPARIVTMSPNTGARNFTLGQENDGYLTRLRSSVASAGFPSIDTPVGQVQTDALTHLVMTRSANGERRMYVDGVLRSSNVVEGSFANWSAFSLGIANEATGGRLWLGTYHLVAVYGRAITADEVSANFTAGAD